MSSNLYEFIIHLINSKDNLLDSNLINIIAKFVFRGVYRKARYEHGDMVLTYKGKVYGAIIEF